MRVKQLPSLVKSTPAFLAWQATHSCPFRMIWALNGGCPDSLMVRCPHSESMMWNE
jgi:hypothetical protein